MANKSKGKLLDAGKRGQLSTLDLWQAQLQALNRANQAKQTSEDVPLVNDVSEQSTSINNYPSQTT